MVILNKKLNVFNGFKQILSIWVEKKIWLKDDSKILDENYLGQMVISNGVNVWDFISISMKRDFGAFRDI